MSGFNTEIMYKGVAFHVQTQDLGIKTQCVESLIYKSGKLLSSRKTFYTSFLASPDLQPKIQEIMEEQHHAILKEIEAGKFEKHISPEEKKSPADRD